MANLNWNFKDQDEIQNILNNLYLVEDIDELTYSKIYINLDIIDLKIKVRLFNTDPVNWNLYMFPYEAEKIRKKMSVLELKNILKNPNKFFNYVGITSFSDKNSWFEGEIKKSKSTSKNTLYIFDYNLIRVGSKRFNFEYIDLEFDSLDSIKKELGNEKKYATNVLGVIEKIWIKKN